MWNKNIYRTSYDKPFFWFQRLYVEEYYCFLVEKGQLLLFWLLVEKDIEFQLHHEIMRTKHINICFSFPISHQLGLFFILFTLPQLPPRSLDLCRRILPLSIDTEYSMLQTLAPLRIKYLQRKILRPYFQIHVRVMTHRKQRFATFPSPAGMSHTEFSLAGNN